MKHQVDVNALKNLIYDNEIAAFHHDGLSKSLVMTCRTDGLIVFKILKHGSLFDAKPTLVDAVKIYNSIE